MAPVVENQVVVKGVQRARNPMTPATRPTKGLDRVEEEVRYLRNVNPRFQSIRKIRRNLPDRDGDGEAMVHREATKADGFTRTTAACILIIKTTEVGMDPTMTTLHPVTTNIDGTLMDGSNRKILKENADPSLVVAALVEDESVDEVLYKEYDVTTFAWDFFLERLGEGYDFAKVLRKSIDRRLGRITTYLVDDVEDGELRYLVHGDVATPRLARAWLATKVQEFLISGRDRIVICENQAAMKGFPYLEKYPSEQRFLGENVYHLLQPDNTELDWIRQTLGVASSADLDIGAFTHVTPEIDLSREDRSITATDLDILAKNVVAAYVSAYDHESYLLWEKNAS
ncbi:MAG: hypothetical protein AABZ47_00055 [Planctomycetota bacterium]